MTRIHYIIACNSANAVQLHVQRLSPWLTHIARISVVWYGVGNQKERNTDITSSVPLTNYTLQGGGCANDAWLTMANSDRSYDFCMFTHDYMIPALDNGMDIFIKTWHTKFPASDSGLVAPGYLALWGNSDHIQVPVGLLSATSIQHIFDGQRQGNTWSVIMKQSNVIVADMSDTLVRVLDWDPARNTVVEYTPGLYSAIFEPIQMQLNTPLVSIPGLHTRRVAICYWGLVRGYRFAEVRESHQKNIIDMLHEAGYEVDVYVHTYNKDFHDSITCVPHLRKIVIESDAAVERELSYITKDILMPHYFSATDKTNLFKCWHSQQRLRAMLQESSETYSMVLTMDVGQRVITPLQNITLLDRKKVYFSPAEQFGGLNPRFCLGKPEDVMHYLNKLAFVTKNPCVVPKMISDREMYLNYDASRPMANMHPETMLPLYMSEYTVEDINFFFYRVRTNGNEPGKEEVSEKAKSAGLL